MKVTSNVGGRRKRRVAKFVTTIAAAGACAWALGNGTGTVTAAVCTIDWDGGGSSDSWTDADNWSTNALPTPSDHVCIEPGTPLTVTYPTSASTSVLTIRTDEFVTLAVTSSGSITATDPAEPNSLGSLELVSTGDVSIEGPLSVAGDLINTGTSTAIATFNNTVNVGGSLVIEAISNNELTGSGSIQVNGGFRFSTGTVGIDVTVAGNTVAAIAGTSMLDTTGVKEIVSGATLTFDGAVDWTAGDIRLWGTDTGIEIGPSSIWNITTTNADIVDVGTATGRHLTNTGTINVTGILDVRTTFTNTGTLTIDAGTTVNLYGGGSTTTPIDVPTTSTLGIAGTFAFDADLTGTGTTRIDGGTTNINTALTFAGDLIIGSGNATITPPAPNLNSITLTATGDLTTNAPISVAGDLINTGTSTAIATFNNTVNVGRTLIIEGISNNELTGSGSIQVNGGLHWSVGNIGIDTTVHGNAVDTVPGTTNIDTNSTKDITSGATLTLHGTTNWTDGSINVWGNNTTLVNTGTLTITAAGHTYNLVTDSTTGRTITNTGTINATTTGTTTIEAPLTNTGTLTIDAGTTLNLSGAGSTSSGTLRVEVIDNGVDPVAFGHLGGAGADLGGTLAIDAPGFAPITGSTYQIITSNNVTADSFTTLTDVATGNSVSGPPNLVDSATHTWEVLYTAGANVTLRVFNVFPIADPISGADIFEGTEVSFPGAFGDADLPSDSHTFLWQVTTDNGQIVPDAASQTFAFTPADDGTYEISFTVTDSRGASDTVSATVTAQNVAPTITAASVGDGNEGSPITASVTFDDPGSLDSHTIAVDWGDTTGVDTFAPGDPINHTYADNPASPATGYTVTFTVSDDDLGVDGTTRQSTIVNVAPTAIVSGDPNVAEGSSYLVAITSFGDPGTDVVQTWTFDWGDGSTADVVSGSSVPTPTHVFADNGSFVVSVSVQDDDGVFVLGTVPVSVDNVAPAISASAVAGGSEGSPVNGSVTWTDAGSADTHRVDVDWGDGTPFDRIDPATSPASMSHTYIDDGVYTVTITVTDDDGSATSDTHVVTIANVAPVVTSFTMDGGAEGTPLSGTLEWTDVGLVDTHTVTIDWGDTSSEPAAPAVSPVPLTHAFPDGPATYLVTVTIDDGDGGVTVDHLEVAVTNVPPTVGTPADSTIIEGDTHDLVLGAVTDPGSPDTIDEWIIAWGDGAVDTIPGPAIPAPSHTYQQDGAYVVAVTISDEDGDHLNPTSTTVTVLNATPVVNAGADRSTNEDAAFSLSGVTFADPGPADVHTATVDWGDGSGPQPATVNGSTVEATTVYTQPGNYTVTVCVTDDDATGCDQFVLTVLDVTPPVITVIGDNPLTIEAGSTYIDPGATALDNVDGTVTVTPGGSVSVGVEGTDVITYTATDAAGNTATATRNVIVDDTIDPTIGIVTPTATVHEFGSSVAAAYSCDDTGTGVGSCVGTVATGADIDTGTLGLRTFTVNATDNGGNAATSSVTYEVRDTIAPSVSITVPVDDESFEAVSGAANLSFTCVDNPGGTGITSCTAVAGPVGDAGAPILDAAALDLSTPGTYFVTVTAVDGDGNATELTHQYSVLDRTAPTLTLNGDAAPVIEAGGAYVEHGATSTDLVDGVELVAPSVGSVDTGMPGTYVITYDDTDAAGNVATPASRTVTVVDTTAPDVVITAPADGATVQVGASIAVDFACTDNATTALACTATAAGASVSDGDPLPTGVLGTFDVVVTATDAATNTTTVTHTYTVSPEPDSTPPIVTALAPADGATYEDGVALVAVFTCVDGESTVSSCSAEVVVGTGTPTVINSGDGLPSTPGSYTLTAAGTSQGGTASDVITYTIVAGTAPNVTITAPADGASYEIGSAVVVDYACSDAESLVTSCNGDLVDGATLDTGVLGTYDFAVTGVDEAGRSKTVTHTYAIVDTGAPDVTIVSPASGAAYDVGTVATVDFSCNDPEGSGVTDCTATIGPIGGAAVPIASGAAIDTSTVGDFRLTVTGTDAGGNLTVVAHDFAVVDPTPPTITVTTPADGAAYEVGSVIAADYTCADPETGVIECAGSIATGVPIDTAALGVVTFTVDATNGAGLTSSASATYSVVDTTAPTLVVNGDDPLIVGLGDTLVDPGAQLVDNYDPTIVVFTGDVVDTSVRGTTTLTYTASDTSGNPAVPVTRDVTVVDATPPVIDIVSPADGGSYESGVPLTASFSCTDAESPVGSCTGELDDGVNPPLAVTAGDPIASVVGHYTLTVTGTNADGYTDTAVSTFDVIAGTPPTATVVSPSDGAVYPLHALVVAEYSCADTESPIATCEARVVDGPIVADGDPLPTDTAGTYAFEVLAIDASGRSSVNGVTYVVEPDPTDTTPPTITITSPADGAALAYLSSVNFGIACTDGDSGIASCSGLITGGPTVVDGDPIDTTVLGTFELTVTGIDVAGNIASLTHTFHVVDMTAPALTLLGADPLVVALGDPFVDPGAALVDDHDPTTTVFTTDVVDTSVRGTTTVTYTASDTSGNAATPVTRDVTVVDTTPPVVVITSPPDSAALEVGSPVSAEFTCTDLESGAGCSATIGRVGESATPIASGDPIDTAALGTFELTVTGTNGDGVSNAVTHVFSVVDTIAPSVTISAPADGSTFVVGAVVLADYTCADDGSGIATCDGDVASGSGIDTATAGTFTFTVTAADLAGNTVTVVHSYTVVAGDVTPPAITILTPLDGSAFVVGDRIRVDYSCTDLESGIATCDGPVRDGGWLRLDTVGSFEFTVVAVDNAGNATSLTAHYEVVGVAAASTVTVEFPGVTGIDVVLRRSDGVDGTATGTEIAVMSMADGSAVFTDIANDTYDVVVIQGSHTIVVDDVVVAGDTTVSGLVCSINVDVSPFIRARLTVQNDDGIANSATGDVVARLYKVFGIVDIPVLAGSYDVTITEKGTIQIFDAISCDP